MDILGIPGFLKAQKSFGLPIPKFLQPDRVNFQFHNFKPSSEYVPTKQRVLRLEAAVYFCLAVVKSVEVPDITDTSIYPL